MTYRTNPEILPIGGLLAVDLHVKQPTLAQHEALSQRLSDLTSGPCKHEENKNTGVIKYGFTIKGCRPETARNRVMNAVNDAKIDDQQLALKR